MRGEQIFIYFGTFHAQLFNALVDIDQNVLKQICHVSRFTLILCVQLLRARPKLRNTFFEQKIKELRKKYLKPSHRQKARNCLNQIEPKPILPSSICYIR